MRKRRITLIVSMDWPEGVTVSRMRDFVEEAINMWGGQLEPPNAYDEPQFVHPKTSPGDPLFGCDKHTTVMWDNRNQR